MGTFFFNTAQRQRIKDAKGLLFISYSDTEEAEINKPKFPEKERKKKSPDRACVPIRHLTGKRNQHLILITV